MEFAPYNVNIWVTFDATTSISPKAQQEFGSQLQAALGRTFRAAWKTELSDLPRTLDPMVNSRLEDLTLDELVANELVLVVSREHPQAQTVRTFEAAMDNLPEIFTTLESRQQLQQEITRRQQAPDATATRLLERLQIDEGGLESLNGKLQSHSIPAALIPRVNLHAVDTSSRTILTPLPWQSDLFLRSIDKLFFLAISEAGDELLLKARELDCGMQFLGPTFELRTPFYQHAVRQACTVLTRAFAPVARVEEADSRTAELRLRAGGLILDAHNPAGVEVGDVMQPIVRRDDRNGLPTLLEPLSWTFAAITQTDGVHMQANVYTYSGGPGLQGRKNRRTRRVVLKVRPRFNSTDIQVLTRGADSKTQSGCSVYRRDLLTDEFNFIGYTDWRGRLTIAVPDDCGQFLPDAVRRARFEAAQATAQAAESQLDGPKIDAATQIVPDSGAGEEATSQSQQPIAEAEVGEMLDKALTSMQDPEALPLNHPLQLLYIKNGNTVLAKLPMVPGLKPVEQAFLVDDSQRLRAEGLVKGFQGEILDLIGIRNLLTARVQLCVKQARSDPELRTAKLEQAEELLTQFRRLPNYNEMSKRLEQIQRDVLEEGGDRLSLRTRNQIDRMFQISRNLLRSYLQDELLAETTRLVENALGGSLPSTTTEEEAVVQE